MRQVNRRESSNWVRTETGEFFIALQLKPEMLTGVNSLRTFAIQAVIRGQRQLLRHKLLIR